MSEMIIIRSMLMKTIAISLGFLSMLVLRGKERSITPTMPRSRKRSSTPRKKLADLPGRRKLLSCDICVICRAFIRLPFSTISSFFLTVQTLKTGSTFRDAISLSDDSLFSSILMLGSSVSPSSATTAWRAFLSTPSSFAEKSSRMPLTSFLAISSAGLRSASEFVSSLNIMIFCGLLSFTASESESPMNPMEKTFFMMARVMLLSFS